MVGTKRGKPRGPPDRAPPQLDERIKQVIDEQLQLYDRRRPPDGLCEVVSALRKAGQAAGTVVARSVRRSAAVGSVEELMLENGEPNHRSKRQLKLRDAEKFHIRLVEESRLGLGFYRDPKEHEATPVVATETFRPRRGGAAFRIGFAPTPLRDVEFGREFTRRARMSASSQLKPLGVLTLEFKACEQVGGVR